MAASKSKSGPEIREMYEEFDLGETVVAMITDPENEYAWIQSDVQLPVET